MSFAHTDPGAVAAARKIIRELAIEEPGEIDLLDIAAYYNVHVEFKALTSEEGHLLRTGKYGIIVVNESARATKKWRFVLAHELGHFFRHVQLDQFEMCRSDALNKWYKQGGHEAEANSFANELLMPESLFLPRCRQYDCNLDFVRQLATEFDTSLTATALRFVELRNEVCAVVHSTNGRIDWVCRAKDFDQFIPDTHPLSRDTYAGDLHAGKTVEDRPQLVPASAWTENDRDTEEEFFEHSIRVGPGVVLTMLRAR